MSVCDNALAIELFELALNKLEVAQALGPFQWAHLHVLINA